MAQILSSLRSGLRGNPAPFENTPQIPEANAEDNRSLDESKSEMDKILGFLLTRYDTLPYEPVPSPRSVIGPAVVFLKRFFLRVLRPFLVMTLHNQIEFNENIADELHLMNRLLKDLIKDTESLYKEFEMLRIKCDQLTEENIRQQKEIKVLKNESSSGLPPPHF